MDGKVIIGTELNSDKFDKQMTQLEKKYANKKIDLDVAAEELSNEQANLESLYNTADELDNKYYEINQKLKEQEKIMSQVTTKTPTGYTVNEGSVKTYENAVGEIERLKSKQSEITSEIEKNNSAIEKQEPIVSRLNAKYEKQLNDLREIQDKIENVKVDRISTQIVNATKSIGKMGDSLKNVANSHVKNISKRIDNVGKSVNNVTKKILKWGLALFGIRAMYNFIRQSASAVLQYNEGLSNQIQFMKTVLATALEPVIKTIVSLIYTLLSFVNSLVKSLTGKDLFAAAKKNLQSGSKSAQEIKKQLAGFDEMNVLSDTSSASAGGGFDTSGFAEENSKLLDILNKYKEMFMSGDWAGIGQSISQAIIGGLTGLVERIKSIDWTGIGLKISEFLTNLDFSGMLVALVTVFGEAVIGFQNLMLAIDWPTVFANLGKGIADAIFKIDEYIGMIEWSKIGTKISETFASIPWGEIGSSIITTLWNSLAGLVDLFLAIDWGQVGETISTAVKDWIDTIIKKFNETDWEQLGQDIADGIFDFIESVDWAALALIILLGLAVGFNAAKTVIFTVFETIISRIMDAFSNLISWLDTNVLGALKKLFGPVGNLLYIPIKWFVETAKGAFEGFFGGVRDVISGIIKIFHGDFFGGIKNIFGGLLNIMLAPLRGFLSGAWGIIQQIYGFFRDLGGKVGEVVGGAFKTVINGVLGAIERILNFPIKQINKLIGIINKVPGINLGKLSTFNLPRLAKGGIVNNPGPGVLMGGYVAGEKGPEAVIPLDDNTLDRLGLAFARHTVINATMINQMNGRVISRELQKINSESDFAYNR